MSSKYMGGDPHFSTLQMLGSEQADERGVQSLLQDLQQMENLLPD